MEKTVLKNLVPRSLYRYLELGELVVTPDVGIVGGQSHQEVDQREDHEEAGDGGDDEHHLCKVMTPFLGRIFGRSHGWHDPPKRESECELFKSTCI